MRLAVLRDRQLEQRRAVDVAERADRAAPVAQRARAASRPERAAAPRPRGRAGTRVATAASGAGEQGRELYRKAREGRT